MKKRREVRRFLWRRGGLWHGQHGAVAEVVAGKAGDVARVQAGDGKEAHGERFVQAVGHRGGVGHDGVDFFGGGVAGNGHGIEADTADAAIGEEGAQVEGVVAAGISQSLVFGDGEHQPGEADGAHVVEGFEDAGEQGGGGNAAGGAKVRHAQQAVDFGH